MTDATNQGLVDEGQEILHRIEADMKALEGVLDRAGGAPFEDRSCNKRFMRLKRRWLGLRDDVHHWHADITDCVQVGDVTVQFGGDK